MGQDLQKRVRELEAQLEQAQRERMEAVMALQVAMEFSSHLPSSYKDGPLRDMLDEAASKVRSILSPVAFAFYVVAPGFPSFDLAGCYPSSKMPLLEREKDILIEDGSFAWAVEASKRTWRTSSDGNLRMLLQPMVSNDRVMGMFLAAMDFGDVPDVKLVFLSVILSSLAGAIQSRQLIDALKEANGELVSRCFSLERSKLEARAERRKLDQEIAEARTEARGAQERVFQVFEAMDDPVLLVDRGHKLSYCNGAFLSRYGLSMDEALGMSSEELLGNGDYAETWRGLIGQALSSGSPIRRDVEAVAGGSRVVFDSSLFPMRGLSGGVEAVGIVLRDVTERRAAEEMMRFMGYHDPLTGLYNRRFFEEEMRRLDTDRQLPLCVLMGDVDGLKLTNDVFGHHEGDRLLMDVAEHLKRSIRREDVLARWGGDEFVVLLPKTDPEVAMEIARRLSVMDSSRKPVPYKITFGLGVKTSPEQDANSVLRMAEDRMYSLKGRERDWVREKIVNSLMLDIEKRSCETCEHRRRVANLALGIGRAMGLEDDDLERLMLLGEYHDVGMVEVGEEVLRKEGPLDRYEMSLVMKHPETGYRVANASSSSLGEIARLILHHHENYDGTGYPHGLKGNQIPLLDRIFRVADSYEVITGGRPYRPPMSPDQALEEIASRSGTWYDPAVVQALLGLMG